MKITEEQLKQLIKEEVKRVLSELEDEEVGRDMLDQEVRNVIEDFTSLNEMPSIKNDELKSLLDSAEKVIQRVDNAYTSPTFFRDMGDEERESLEEALRQLLDEAMKFFESDIEVEDYDYENGPDVEMQVIAPIKDFLEGIEENEEGEEGSYDEYMRYRNPSLR